MKRILCAVLITVGLTTPALAAKLYLKEGGVIQAKRVWRSGGKVHVLATRHTQTSFEPSEVNLKRTFPKKRRVVRKAVVAAQSAQTTNAPATETATPKAAEKKNRFSLPELPKLPERSPESLVPSSGGGGSIKKHKKEMAERLGE
jgi:hypothetical protein